MVAMSAESIESTNRVLNAYVENGVLFGETESCLGKRNPVWENRALSGETESWLERPLEDSPQEPPRPSATPLNLGGEFRMLIAHCVFVFSCAFLWLIFPQIDI